MNVGHSSIFSATGMSTLKIFLSISMTIISTTTFTTTTISSPTTIVVVMMVSTHTTANCTYGAKVSAHVTRELKDCFQRHSLYVS